MAFAQQSRTRVSFIKEVTPGTTPAGAHTEIPVVSSSLNLAKTVITSSALNSNRQKKFSRHGNKTVSGDINTEFSYGQWDTLMEGVMMSAWATNTLKTGTTKTYYTIEEAALDIGQFRVFKGCIPNTMTLSVANDAIITSSFGFVGMNMTRGTATTSTSIVPPIGTSQPFVHKEGTITINGTAAAYIASYEVTFDNGAAPTFVVGSDVAADVPYGDATITGTVNAYFPDAVLYDLFLNETEVPMVLSMLDPAGNNVTLTLPQCQFNTGDIPVGGQGPRQISLDFECLYNTTAGSNAVWTRLPA